MHNDLSRIDWAIQTTAQQYPGGAQALGKAVGSKPSTFTNKCNPNETAHRLTLDEVIAVLRVSQHYLILEVIARELGFLAVPTQSLEGQLSDLDVVRSWTAWDVENGELAGVIGQAFEDGQITVEEYEKVRVEMYEEFAVALHLLRLLEAHLTRAGDCPILQRLQQQVVSPTVDSAIDQTVSNYNGDLVEIAALLGLRAGNLKRKLNPSDRKMRFNIHEIYRLMKQTEDHRILLAMAAQFGFACIHVPYNASGSADQELLDVWSARANERAETWRSIHSAISCDKPERKDILLICTEMFEDFQASFALLRRLETLPLQPQEPEIPT